MSFPSGCSDHDFNYLMQLFRGQHPREPHVDDEQRLIRAGWLCRAHDGALTVSAEVERHFGAVWRPIIVDAPRRAAR
jgi:hypothetical protein